MNSLNEMPAVLPVHAAFEPTNPAYDCASLDMIDGLYDSRLFAKSKRDWLTPRNADRTAPGYLNARIACAAYTNHFAAKLDDVLGEITKDRPHIFTNPGEPNAAYWDALNSDTDGNGNDFNAVTCAALLDLLKHGRGYFVLKLPATSFLGGTIEDAKTSGAMAYKIGTLDARGVDDWETDAAGNLTMIRFHEMKLERTAAYLPPLTEKHTFTFYRADGIYVYTATRPYKPNQVQKWDNVAKALLTKIENPLGRLTVFPLNVRDGYSLGHRLAGPARSLFNAEAARTFAIEAGALNQPIIKTEKQVKDVLLNEFSMVAPGIGGDFGWAAPPESVFNALKSQCDDLRALFNAVAAGLGDQASAQPQNARQSASAKKLDRSNKAVLLASHSEPVRDALESIVKVIATVRNETTYLQPRVVGLYDSGPDVQELIAETTDFLAIEGMPATARTAAVRELIFTRLPNLSPADRAAIERELKAQSQSATLPHGHAIPIERLAEPYRERVTA